MVVWAAEQKHRSRIGDPKGRERAQRMVVWARRWKEGAAEFGPKTVKVTRFPTEGSRA